MEGKEREGEKRREGEGKERERRERRRGRKLVPHFWMKVMPPACQYWNLMCVYVLLLLFYHCLGLLLLLFIILLSHISYGRFLSEIKPE